MSADTPIFDATCRAVGPPPHVHRTGSPPTDEAHPPSGGVSGSRTETEDPVTSDLSFPGTDSAPPA
jgi:hypothetical protein